MALRRAAHHRDDPVDRAAKQFNALLAFLRSASFDRFQAARAAAIAPTQ
jgi:hypothetical protein